MKLFSDHKGWWIGLIVASFAVAIATAQDADVFFILGGAIGMILFSLLFAGITWAVYRLIGKPMTTTQIMSTVTVAWIISALLQFVASTA